ncbi:tetratricopeptide repeat protein [Microtetraspora malaysiensis]|uniref:Tetratricopeptide repeat protein n=1 Tax=Microtetraspora malaysiensis TaxID=161358 RepID=A0ABW6SV33_9ACTN
MAPPVVVGVTAGPAHSRSADRPDGGTGSDRTFQGIRPVPDDQSAVPGHRAAPYTVASALLHAIVPGARKELVDAHDIEIRAAAPGLRDVVPAVRGSLAAHLPKAERILVPAPRRTLRLANGLAEFVHDHLKEVGPAALVVERADVADETDQEFLAVLLRRIDPALLTVVVCAESADPVLTAALKRHALPVPDGGATVAGGSGQEEHHSYHESRSGDEHGPEVVERYFTEGFHHAAARLGVRVLRGAHAEADPNADPDAWWSLVHRTAGALAAVEREDEARAILDRARRESADPKNRATAAYATAMLLMRHHDPAARDVGEALSWIDEAVAITSSLPDRRERAFHLSFDLNGKALVVMRAGRPEEALRLVEQAIELADRDLDPGEHPIHRLVLRANRGQLTAMLGDPERALADLDAAVAADPGYPDYYISRGNLLHRLGRPQDAVADYETAMRAGPPFPEAYYNRAEIRFQAGDHAGALADLDYALELDPGFADAYANRAGLFVEFGEYGRARADALQGLALDPRNAYLLCVLGQVEAAEGRHAEARKAFDTGLRHDPALAALWVSRGILAFETGAPEDAVADLTRALERGDDPAVRFNRAVALRALGRDEEAREDLLRAAELAPGDEDIRRELAAVSPDAPSRSAPPGECPPPDR